MTENTANTNTADTTDIKSIPATTLTGAPLDLHDFDGPLLIVNVASKCGLTPQYTALEQLQKTYSTTDGTGLTVVGVPFPLLAKTDVNGEDRDPLYQALTTTKDAEGEAGDIQWNFEKFLVSADGRVLNRFRPQTTPDDPAVIDAIEAAL
ncbi:glutathione peroxidase [Corynebacterium variabile]|uniref:glutathione peroxidase n=1 Tax=Corynebacterium variabile TaxID=1727 RepID=UPI0028B1F87D|nr:glutathione peroxidase [Corynebacterium variabile]